MTVGRSLCKLFCRSTNWGTSVHLNFGLSLPSFIVGSLLSLHLAASPLVPPSYQIRLTRPGARNPHCALFSSPVNVPLNLNVSNLNRWNRTAVPVLLFRPVQCHVTFTAGSRWGQPVNSPVLGQLPLSGTSQPEGHAEQVFVQGRVARLGKSSQQRTRKKNLACGWLILHTTSTPEKVLILKSWLAIN